MTTKLTGFSSYQKPGAYTKSIRGISGFNNFGGYRIPTFVGPVSELVLKEDVPVVRGSSKRFPIYVDREDISYQLASGTAQVIQTSKAPIVNPTTNEVTNNVQYISLEIDGHEVTPLKIVGENEDGISEIHLPFIADAGAKGYISYHYIRRDKSVSSEDLSSQVDGSATTFYTKHKNIVDNSDTGSITNDPSYISVKVNGFDVPVLSLDGREGKFELASAVASSAILNVSYKYTDYLDFSDPLPNKFIHSITRVGNVSQRKDYVDGVDFNLSNEFTINSSTFHEISWGNSFAVRSLQASGNEFENTWALDENISLQVSDYKIYGELAKPVYTDGNNSGLTNEYEADFRITDGSGRGKDLFDSSIDSSIFAVYVGTSAYEALPNGASVDGNQVAVRRVDGENRKIYLQTPIDPKVQGVFIIYHTNFMEDNSYQFVKSADEMPDPVNVGETLPAEYQIKVSDYGYAPRMYVQRPSTGLTDPTLSQGINPYYAESYEDIRVPVTHNQDEIITISFQNLDGYEVTSSNYGLRDAIPGTDVGGNLITYTFPSSGRDFSSFVGNATLTVDGFSNTVNNVSNADIIDAGVDSISVRVVTPGQVETIPSSSPYATAEIFFNSNNTYKYVVSSNVSNLTGSNTSINEGFNGTIHEGLRRNEGVLGEPYIDPVSGIFINIRAQDNWTIQPGVTEISFKVSAQGSFPVSSTDTEVNLNGLRYRVDHLDGVSIGDSIEIETNNFSGDEPELGDTYFVSYYHYRIDYDAHIFDDLSVVEDLYGPANLENPLSLAAKFAFENGAPVVALKPLQRYTEDSFAEYLAMEVDSAGEELLNIQRYKDAFDTLALPLELSKKPYFMVPLTDDSQVVSYAKAHVERYSAPEWVSERYLITGFNTNRTDAFVLERAKNLKSDRMMMVYPPVLVADIEENDGTVTRATVPGYYLASAIAGYASGSGVLPSEPLTRKSIQGFVDIPITKTELMKNELAQEGVTIVDFEDPEFKIRHALNTDITDTLTREPTVTFIADYIQLLARKVLDRFIARPHVNTILGEIETTFTGFLNIMQTSGIITAYKDVRVEEHPTDPTIVLVSAKYSPVFPINYIFVTFQIEGRIN